MPLTRQDEKPAAPESASPAEPASPAEEAPLVVATPEPPAAAVVWPEPEPVTEPSHPTTSLPALDTRTLAAQPSVPTEDSLPAQPPPPPIQPQPTQPALATQPTLPTQSPAAAPPAAAPPKSKEPAPAAWSVVPVEEKPVPKPEPDLALRGYAEWWAWAKAQKFRPAQCHLAAQAALAALGAGADQNGAAAAALAATAREDQLGPIDGHHQTYVAWFAMARLDFGLDIARSHAFAEAGAHETENGADIKTASAAAQRAAGLQ
ncbi:MAG TPA: hypothetical protein VK131_00945 [Candidatus Acidoferrales bacterium]|nr:hypothetical protein [Candidatus Acidoferrales bacterium]